MPTPELILSPLGTFGQGRKHIKPASWQVKACQDCDMTNTCEQLGGLSERTMQETRTLLEPRKPERD